MRSKIFLSLFALPFFGVGVWMTWSIGSNLLDSWQMHDWVPAYADLSDGGYQTHSGEDSDSYEAYASYQYQFNGIRYFGERVGLSSGADNIGDYQRDMGSWLNRAHSRRQAIEIFVNPADPSQAIIDRSIRWGLLGFKSIFMLVFGGVGLGLLIVAIRKKRQAETPPEAKLDKPWLANEDWRTPVMRSNSRMAMFVAWGVAVFWNLISAPLPFVIYGEVFDKSNYIALVGLLFPMFGIGLLVWAARRSLEWRRFGHSPLTLDPFPGAIGGDVGGTVDLRLPFDAAIRCTMTLTSIRSYISGSGKNRSRREKAKWQDRQVAHIERGGRGSKLSFRFDVPDGLTQSDATQDGDTYYLWRLNLHAEIDGTDIDRDYEIPVYPTGQRSSALAEFSIQKARQEQEQADEQFVRDLLRSDYGPGGRSLLFPAGRNVSNGLVGSLTGGAFFSVGWYLLTRQSEWFIGGGFSFVGAIVLLSSLYFMFNSLEVRQDGSAIKAVRRVFGITIGVKQTQTYDIVRFGKKSSLQSNSGGKHVMHYKIFTVDRHGQKMTVGEGFRGASQADTAIRIIARELGISVPTMQQETSGLREQANFLGQDA